MSIDNGPEQQLEKIRQTVKLEEFTPEGFVNNWRQIFGEETDVRRERFVNQNGNEIGQVKDSILENVKITPAENLVILTYKGNEERFDKYLVIDRKDHFMGVQNHDNGEKSFILVHNKKDKITGENKQITRRFTPVKTN